MAWYDTGTVSVTNGSTTVTGSGTNFVAGAQVGEGFYGPDGRLYEIQAIVSATQLTLADSYIGTTQTGQAYKIVPTQSLVATLASQVTTLINDFQTVADEAGSGKFADGSAASPGITFTGDQDTGLFHPTANTMAITTGGVERARVNSTGINVTGTLTADGLTVDGAGSVTGNFTVDTSTLFVDATNNRVGVGTATPSQLLEVYGNSGTSIIRLSTADAGATTFDGSGDGFELLASQMNTTNKYTPAIKFGSTDSNFTTTNPKFGAAIVATAAQTYGADTNGGMDLFFWTSNANPGTGHGLEERMVIRRNGYVGIATSSPSALLDVAGDAKINGITVGLGSGSLTNNTALGQSALGSVTTGGSNTATGYLALTANTTGNSNVAVGREALEANTTGTNNVAVGLRALEANTTGTNNVAVGHSALAVHTVDATSAFGHFALTSNTTGTNNSAFGYTALRYNTTGAANTAIGREALTANTTGANNTAVGLQALTTNTTGVSNSAFGYQALMSNTTGVNNTAVGYQALTSNTTESNNTAVGYQSLSTNTTGTSNTASGYRSLYSNTTGGSVSAFGFQALAANTTGSNNSAFGRDALVANTTGISNTAVGLQALKANTTANSNTAVGVQALSLNTTGALNTAVGQGAGDVLTTGSRNTILGYACDPSALDALDQVVVGYALTGKGNDTAFIGGLNGAYNEKNVTTWETTSDERIKKNIVDNNDGLSVLSQIQVRNFEYRTPEEITELPSHAAIEKDGIQLGVIAQELQKVLPECVSENSTGVLSVNTDPLVWYLINAVKELKAEIEQLKGK